MGLLYLLPGIFPGGKEGLCIGLTNLSPSCADCLEIWEPQPPGTLRACNGIALPLPLPLKYKSVGRGFDSRLPSKFFIDIILPDALWLLCRLTP